MIVLCCVWVFLEYHLYDKALAVIYKMYSIYLSAYVKLYF